MRTSTTPKALATLALIGLAPLALAQSPRPSAQEIPEAQEIQEIQEERAPDGRALRRILYLHGGTTLRAVARPAGDGWEYKRGGTWRSMPVEMVRRVVLERDVKRELTGRQRRAGEDLAARSAVGAWALETGLLKEGLALLERVLAADPDEPVARATLAANARRFSLPRVDVRAEGAEDVARSTEELRRWCSARGAGAREMGIAELSRVRDRQALGDLLERELFATTVGRRDFAALALRRLFTGHALRPLIHRAVLDGSETVRRGAALALRDSGQVGVIVPVVKAMASPRGRVRAQAAEALGNMGYPAAVEPLMTRLASVVQSAAGHNVPHSYIFIGKQFAFIQDFDVEVAQFQAVADPQVNVLVEGSVLEAGVHGVSQVEFAGETRAIRSSLGKLTGANPGRTSRAWLRWWEENQDEWRTAQLARAPR